MKVNILFFSVLFFSLYSVRMNAQLINGCCFLQQNRLEVGIANNGAFGTPENAPAGYHSNNSPLFATVFNPVTGIYAMRPNALGFVADYDSNGWTLGSPPFFGDYFLPGIPQEGWAVEVDGIRSDAFCAAYQTNGTSGFTGSLLGANTAVFFLGNSTKSEWNGNMGSLAIKQITTIEHDKLYLTVKVKFYNTGTTTLHDVYYMRTVDPDNDVAITNNFTTINEIEYQLPNPEHKTLIGCTSIVDTNAFLGLGSIDCRSKVFAINLGLFPPDTTLASLYAGHPDLMYQNSIIQDAGVGIVFNLGDIAAGDSTELNLVYVVSKSQMNQALQEIEPQLSNNGMLTQNNDTIFACPNTIVPVSITNSNGLTWTWSSSALLSNTVGTTNAVTFANSPVWVTAIGSGICSDTISFYLAPASSLLSTINASICNGVGFVYNGVTYTSAGTFTDTISVLGGCDSIVTLQLTNGSPTSSVLNVTLCSGTPYSFNNALLMSSGVYYDTLTNTTGCDSIVTLNLIVNTTYNYLFLHSGCDSYSFFGQTYTVSGSYSEIFNASNGCDSIFHLDLTLSYSSDTIITQTSCVDFTINGQTYISSGTYTQTLINAAGCDSNLTLNLTIDNVDVAVVQAGANFTANAFPASYQWIDCNSNTIIPGETNQTFIASANGNYAVIVDQNGCIDTSGCKTVSGVQIVEINRNDHIDLYPNPTEGPLSIQFGDTYPKVYVTLCDITGRVLMMQTLQRVNKTNISIEGKPGVYLMTVEIDSRKHMFKILKN